MVWGDFIGLEDLVTEGVKEKRTTKVLDLGVLELE